MSNNRKRNLKKLARSIVGATAMVSSLNAPMHAANEPSQGLPEGVVVGAAGAAIGLMSVGAQVYSTHVNSKASEAALAETRNQNKTTNDRLAKAEARQEKDQSLGVDAKQIGDIVGNLSALAGRLNKKCEATPDMVRAALEERKGAAAVLREGIGAIDAAHQNAILHALTSRMCLGNSAPYVKKGLEVLANAPKDDKLLNSLGAMGGQDPGGISTNVASLKRVEGGIPNVTYWAVNGAQIAANVPAQATWLGSGTLDYHEKSIEAFNALLPPGLETIMKNCGTVSVFFCHYEDGTNYIRTRCTNDNVRADVLRCLNTRDATARFGYANNGRAQTTAAMLRGDVPIVIGLGIDAAQANNAARVAANTQNFDIIPLGGESQYQAKDSLDIRKLAVKFGMNQFAHEDKKDNSNVWTD